MNAPAVIHLNNAPSVVRLATPDDAKEIWRLLLQSHRENALFSLAPEKVGWFLSRVLYPETIADDDTGTRGVIGVIGTPQSLEAMVFLTIGQYWYTNDRHLEEFIVYTDPEHRRSNHVKALLQWMKDQVEALQMPLFTGIISNIRTEAKCRLYRQMLPKVGEFFCLPPKGSRLSEAQQVHKNKS